jgi:hypothetical protein
MKEKFQNKKVREAVDLLLEGGVDLSKALEKGGLIKELTKAILERAMEAEMSEHLGYEPYESTNHVFNKFCTMTTLLMLSLIMEPYTCLILSCRLRVLLRKLRWAGR